MLRPFRAWPIIYAFYPGRRCALPWAGPSATRLTAGADGFEPCRLRKETPKGSSTGHWARCPWNLPASKQAHRRDAHATGFTGKGSKLRQRRYLEEVIDGYSTNYEPLTAFFAVALERGLLALGPTT